jgi:RNA polymerase sigma-70 factor (ECF subfamily)
MEPPSLALPPDVDPVRVEEFLKLIALHQRRLHLFVGGLVPFPPDAEDVLQETNLVLWREFRKFELGSDFAAWACTVAFHQVLAWRKKKQRDRLVFSEAFLAAVSQELLDHDEQREEQASALAGCIARMPTHHRQLLALRYSDGQSIESIAARLHRTTDAVYRMLSRIRHALFDCTTRALSEGPT